VRHVARRRLNGAENTVIAKILMKRLIMKGLITAGLNNFHHPMMLQSRAKMPTTT
jgi:hypothetical protein